eukprot:CAMPEP_0203892634 /NCGR_PEP_ID=MMETSP0359-20131031/35808_1 /ASSEMBLY_ACC=CAM_ASM_000338 /TAXON_ID=268821 /ORGANISM="Scrippsiella Hangoei, Strain SHTV-5" /LENGTH=265 /DNA_ID=CAMNT_0050814639 /DNA_START=54 /DNA_END=852 /DNA_ORIENTATION=+
MPASNSGAEITKFASGTSLHEEALSLPASSRSTTAELPGEPTSRGSSSSVAAPVSAPAAVARAGAIVAGRRPPRCGGAKDATATKKGSGCGAARLCVCERRKRLAFCTSLAGLLALVAIALVWPRAPSWEVRRLSADVSFANSSSRHADFGSALAAALAVPSTSQVEVWNWNFLPISTGRGSFLVTYAGDTLAVGVLEPARFGARGVAEVTAHGNVTISPGLIEGLVDALHPTYEPHVSVTGSVPIRAKILWGLDVDLTSSARFT